MPDIIRDKQSKILSRMTELRDRITTEDRGFNTEEQSEWTKLVEESERLRKQREIDEQVRSVADGLDDEKQEEDRKLAYQQSRRSQELPPDAQKVPDRPWTPAEKRQAFRGWAMGKNASETDAEVAQRAGLRGNELTIQFPRESGVPRSIAEVNSLYDKRALTGAQGTTTAGGYTVADEMMRAIEISMLTFGNVRGVATVISTATGAPMPIPTTNDTGNVGVILPENTVVAAQDVAFGQLTLDAFKYSSKSVLCSIEFMQDSTLNIGAFMGRILGERLARITNQHFTTGTGSGEPRGIVAAAGTSSITTASNTAITWAECIGLKHAVDPAYRIGGAWMCDDAIVLQMKKMLDAENRPLWIPSIADGGVMRLDGDPLIVNNDMATGSASKELIYGQFSKYIVREVAGFQLLRLDERYADYHQVGFFAFLRADGDLLDAGTDPVKFLTAAT